MQVAILGRQLERSLAAEAVACQQLPPLQQLRVARETELADALMQVGRSARSEAVWCVATTMFLVVR